MEVLRYSALNAASWSKYAIGIMFNFYLGLSHMYTVVVPVKQVGAWTPNGVSVCNSQDISTYGAVPNILESNLQCKTDQGLFQVLIYSST